MQRNCANWRRRSRSPLTQRISDWSQGFAPKHASTLTELDCWSPPKLPMPMPVPVKAPQTQEQMTQPGAWTPDQAIAATVAAQKQQNIDFFAGLPNVPGPDCTNWFTYLTNSDCPVDCTNTLSSIFNSSCGGGKFLFYAVAGVLVIGGLLVLKVVR